MESDAPATPGDYSLEFDLIQEGSGSLSRGRINPKL
jgi:hypothetical protein